jgi:hypothetical protein
MKIPFKYKFTEFEIRHWLINNIGEYRNGWYWDNGSIEFINGVNKTRGLLVIEDEALAIAFLLRWS